jgi:hypothetical protein
MRGRKEREEFDSMKEIKRKASAKEKLPPPTEFIHS